MPEWARTLLEDGIDYVRCVRSFADPAIGHSGTIYQAAGAWYCGVTRREVALVGRRSGHGITRRTLSKLRHAGRGHPHQVLRAVWEGSSGSVTVIDRSTRETLGTFSLERIRETVPDGLVPAERQRSLRASWLAERRRIAARLGRAVGECEWVLHADTAGYSPRESPPKHRYVHFLSARPAWTWQMVRRCRYLRHELLSAEAVWYAAGRRWPRGLGFNWPRRPSNYARPDFPGPSTH